jgi:hypothetical protein
MLNNTCLNECPWNYLKSEDGSTCERRTYPLDRTFIAFPILGTAVFFTMVTWASYWLTGHGSKITSSLIAFFGPIEMAAALYQFLYTLQGDRNFVPIKVGSICCFAAGMALNIVFVINFHKQVKNRDKDFKKWRKRKWFAANFFLTISGMISLTLYRLIFCRLFRLDMMDVKVSMPQRFLRPIFIFTTIKVFVFNLPLMIIDIYGLSILSWGN